MSLVKRLAQGAAVGAALLGFLAGGALAPRDLFGFGLPGLVPLAVLLAGAGLAAYALERVHRGLLLAGLGLLLAGVLDTGTRALTLPALGYALVLVAAFELSFGYLRAQRVPDPEARARLLTRYLRDLGVPMALVAVAVAAGVGLFLLGGGLLPDAFGASLERLSPFGILASALLAAALLIGYALARRALRRRRAPKAEPAAPDGEAVAPAAGAEAR